MPNFACSSSAVIALMSVRTMAKGRTLATAQPAAVLYCAAVAPYCGEIKDLSVVVIRQGVAFR